MRLRLRFSQQAVQDIEDVLAYTLGHFGQRRHEQYKLLIRQALAEIASRPNAPPARHRPEIHADARTFHIARAGKRARHFFLYRVIEGQSIDIGRLLHDSMDLQRHLPDGFASQD